MILPDNDLPEFEKPPVIEVALSVQFDSIFGLTSPRIVEFWADRMRSRFPKAQDAPPVPPQVEWFGLAPGHFRLAIQLMPVGTPSRWVFTDPNANELVQLQQDRFVRNWRKVGDGDSYPRYPRIRQSFEEDFGEFVSFLERAGLPAAVPSQCEVTYVNHIDVPEGATHGEPGQFLASWSGKSSDDFLGKPESVETTSRFAIMRDGQPAGRLHITTVPAHTGKDGRPVFLMTLTARGRPAEPTLAGVLSFLDLGREYVVRGFTSATTAAAHAGWRRRR